MSKKTRWVKSLPSRKYLLLMAAIAVFGLAAGLPALGDYCNCAVSWVDHWSYNQSGGKTCSVSEVGAVCYQYQGTPWCMPYITPCCWGDSEDQCGVAADISMYYWKDYYECTCKDVACGRFHTIDCGASLADRECTDCGTMACWMEEGVLRRGWYWCAH